jgi:hypothetical protein
LPDHKTAFLFKQEKVAKKRNAKEKTGDWPRLDE